MIVTLQTIAWKHSCQNAILDYQSDYQSDKMVWVGVLFLAIENWHKSGIVWWSICELLQLWNYFVYFSILIFIQCFSYDKLAHVTVGLADSLFLPVCISTYHSITVVTTLSWSYLKWLPYEFDMKSSSGPSHSCQCPRGPISPDGSCSFCISWTTYMISKDMQLGINIHNYITVCMASASASSFRVRVRLEGTGLHFISALCS